MKKDGSILVGASPTPIWKKIDIDKNEPAIYWSSVAYQMMNFDFLRLQDIDLVPTRFINILDLPHLDIIQLTDDTPTILEKAYFEHEYDIPTGGIEVQLEHYGSIQRILLKVIPVNKGVILAQITTPYGQTLTYIDLDVADGYALDRIKPPTSYLHRLVADVYKDLVTAKKIDPNKRRRSNNLKSLSKIKTITGKAPSYRLLPRTRSHDGTVQRKYKGITSPRKPTELGGFCRNVPMTETHYKNLLRWQQETGFRVPWHTLLRNNKWDDNHNPPYTMVEKSGRTYVRGHWRPAPTSEQVKAMPQFIKYRIQEQIYNAKLK